MSFTPTSASEQARTGRYWHVDVVGEHAPPRDADATVWERTVPSPEQFHPDERWARRRVPRLSPLLRAASLADVNAALDDEARRRWQEFWDVVVPRARIACDAGWEAVVRLARDLRTEYDAPAIDAFDRIRGAVTTALLERVEARVLRREPPWIEPPSYFHVSLWAHAAIAGDPSRIGAVLADPSTVATTDVSGPGVEPRGLMVLTALRRELMTLHARKHRLMVRLQMATGAPSPAIPGFHLAMPALADALPDPDERLPQLVMLPDGNWTFNGTRVLDRSAH